MHVEWENECDEYLCEECAARAARAARVPFEVLSAVTGTAVFEELSAHVTPLHEPFDEQLVAASQRLIAAHANRFTDSASRHIVLQVLTIILAAI